MISFIGDYTGKVDAKGRAVLPSAFKKQAPESVAGKFVLKKDTFENCLILYTAEEWERQNAIIRAKFNPNIRKHNLFLREYFRGTAEVSLDSAGRISIPVKLREYAKIEKEIYFCGQDMKIEIWSKSAYESIEQAPEDFALLAEELFGNDNSQ